MCVCVCICANVCVCVWTFICVCACVYVYVARLAIQRAYGGCQTTTIYQTLPHNVHMDATTKLTHTSTSTKKETLSQASGGRHDAYLVPSQSSASLMQGGFTPNDALARRSNQSWLMRCRDTAYGCVCMCVCVFVCVCVCFCVCVCVYKCSAVTQPTYECV